MKIIRAGKLPSERTHKAQCSNCHAEFEFTEKEARYESIPNNESAWIVKCPTQGCGKEVSVYA